MLPIIAALGKAVLASAIGNNQDNKGTTGPSVTVDDLNKNISQMNSNLKQDRGFYGHMTVGKARKNKRIKIIGMGE